MKRKAWTLSQILILMAIVVGCAKSDDSSSPSNVLPVTGTPGTVIEPTPVAPILVETPVQIAQPSTTPEEAVSSPSPPSENVSLPVSKGSESLPSHSLPILETVELVTILVPPLPEEPSSEGTTPSETQPSIEPENQEIEMKGQCAGKKNVVIQFGDQRKPSHSEKLTVKCVSDSFLLRLTLKKKDLPFVVVNIE